MPFKPGPKQPDFLSLKSVLSTSHTTVKDKALNQVITRLLEQCAQFQKIEVGDIESINKLLVEIDNSINNINILIAALETLTYLTTANETAQLPNSRRLLAGTNITFDDTVAGQRTINGSGGAQDDYVVMSDGANPPSPMDDGNGNFMYITYTAP